MKRKFFLSLICSVMFLGLATGCGNNQKVDNDNAADNNNEEIVQKCDGNDVVLKGLKGDTVDYYYNIDTSKFDKTLFDGKINFYGATVNGKLTTNSLAAAGVSMEFDTLYINYKTSNWDASVGPVVTYFYTPKFSVNTSTVGVLNNYIQMDAYRPLKVVDYTGGTEKYSDTALILCTGEYYWDLSGRNIYPAQFGISDYSEITIDLVLEKLGNPTYVDGRKKSCLKDKYTYTRYVYVYDEVVFLFAFYNWDNMKLASVYYYPIEQLNGMSPAKVEYNGKEYSSEIEVLELEKAEYEKNK